MYSSNPLLLRKAGICEFPPDLDSLQKGRALWEIVFQGLLHWMCRSWSDLSFFWGYCSYVAAMGSVCLWEEMRSGSSYITIFNWNLSLFLKKIKA